MKNILVLISLTILIGCNQQKSSKQNSSVTENDALVSNYPSIIDSLSLWELYDKAKWTLYCIYSDDTCRVKKQFSVVSDKTFGSLDLRFSDLRQQKDTIEMDFYFYVNDTLRYDISTMANNKRLASGVGYKKDSDSILFYLSQTTMRYFWEKGMTSRYQNPMQPEVIDYINPWFKKEAKRRGIIE
jgi:hypothetical protein